MTEEMIKGLSLSELKKEDFNKLKKWKEEEYSKIRSVSKSLPDQPNITSHSFRVGYISQLWKDTKDIEFVKQSIGHRRMDTTSSYVEKLSDQERQERTLQLK